MSQGSTFGGIGRALSSRDFRLYWIGMSASGIGSWAFRTALGWLVWKLTGSTAFLGIAAFAEVLPAFLIAPLAGTLVDRIGSLNASKWVLIAWSLYSIVLAGLTFAGLINIEILIAMAFLQGVINAFNNPSQLALVAILVPRSELAPAVALQSATVQGSRFIGPAIAGAVIAVFESQDQLLTGIGTVFGFNALSFLIFYGALLMVAATDTPHEGRWSDGLLNDFVAGLKYTANSYPIRTILLFTIVMAVFLRSVFELFPGFADDVFNRGADGLAWLLSVGGASAMLAALWIARRGNTDGLTKHFAAHLLIGAVVLIAFASTKVFWLAVVLSGVLAFSANVVSISAQTLVQNAVAGAMRARVMSIVGLTFRAVPATGALLIGFLAEIYGLAAPVIGGAVVTIIAALWMMIVISRRDLARLAEKADDQTGPRPRR